MNPDLLIVLGVFSLGGAAAATISAFSSSNISFRPAFAFLLLGLALLVWALSVNPTGYSLSDIPRIIWDGVKSYFTA